MQADPANSFRDSGPRRTISSLILAVAALCLTFTGVACAATAPGAPFALVSPRKAEALEHSSHRTRGAALRNGEKVRRHAAHPVPRLQIEGRLPHRGGYDESMEAAKDFTAARDLALAGRLTRDPEKLKRAAGIISAWLAVYHPTYNPIDESRIDSLIIAYDLLPPDVKAPLAKPMNNFLRELAEGYLDRLPQVTDKTATNNWQSHRIKLITLASYALGDRSLIAQAKSAYRTQLANNIRPDGSTVDFQERDAVHYVVYDLEPLALAALAAQEHGEDWYHLKNPAGVGLEEALLWLKPYADGSATHDEFVRSKVKFDAERRKAGIAEFRGQFDPKGARGVMMIAARLDPRFIPTTKELGWSTPLFDLVWPLRD
ncbi:alginate lyase family protein [Geomonas sp. RF6]|uniref:alginate lyase family protein n=1 Tax=Geomonas sp. RF6 TaxID=2897342 RepID=UPI001E3879E0|nr:alginate lyase family protein [Geomonas sp. RF6]UFS68801.1 alginate lyase family protein [Geomonas sp. RF6]